MATIRRLVLTLLASGIVVVPVAAQNPSRTPNLLLTGGYTAFADDGRIDHGGGGAGVEWVLTPRIAVGPEVLYMVGPGRDRDLLLLGTIRAGFLPLDRRVAPYVVAAAGVMRHSDTWPGGSYSDASWMVAWGGGVRIQVTERVLVAPEFVMGMAPHVRAALTVGVRLGR